MCFTLTKEKRENVQHCRCNVSTQPCPAVLSASIVEEFTNNTEHIIKFGSPWKGGMCQGWDISQSQQLIRLWEPYGAIGLQWIMLLFRFINAIDTGYTSWSRIILRKVWWLLSWESEMYLKIIGICSGTSVFLSCKWIFNYVFTESLIYSCKLEQLHNWEKSTIFLFLDQTEPSVKQSQIAPSAAIVRRTFRSGLTVHTQMIIKGWCPYKNSMPSLVVPCEMLVKLVWSKTTLWNHSAQEFSTCHCQAAPRPFWAPCSGCLGALKHQQVWAALGWTFWRSSVSVWVFMRHINLLDFCCKCFLMFLYRGVVILVLPCLLVILWETSKFCLAISVTLLLCVYRLCHCC